MIKVNAGGKAKVLFGFRGDVQHSNHPNQPASQVQSPEYPVVHTDRTNPHRIAPDCTFEKTDLYEVEKPIMFYPATLESTIRFCMTDWFGKLQTKSTHIVLTAIKITVLKRNKSLQSSFVSTCFTP